MTYYKRIIVGAIAMLLLLAVPAQARHNGRRPCQLGPKIARYMRCIAKHQRIGISGDKFVRMGRCESNLRRYARNGRYRSYMQQDVYYWPARARRYGFAGHGIYHRKAHIRVSAGMIKREGLFHWPVCRRA